VTPILATSTKGRASNQANLVIICGLRFIVDSSPVIEEGPCSFVNGACHEFGTTALVSSIMIPFLVD
jgi:hypothetical protein